jgi:hypothetical protein
VDATVEISRQLPDGLVAEQLSNDMVVVKFDVEVAYNLSIEECLRKANVFIDDPHILTEPFISFPDRTGTETASVRLVNLRREVRGIL